MQSFVDKVYQTVCADTGADLNLMDEKLLQKLIDQEINIKVYYFSKPVAYEMATEDENESPAKIKCYKKFTLDMELLIPH